MGCCFWLQSNFWLESQKSIHDLWRLKSELHLNQKQHSTPEVLKVALWEINTSVTFMIIMVTDFSAPISDVVFTSDLWFSMLTALWSVVTKSWFVLCPSNDLVYLRGFFLTGILYSSVCNLLHICLSNRFWLTHWLLIKISGQHFVDNISKYISMKKNIYSDYLNPFCPRSMMPYGITRPQRVNSFIMN